jgi:lipoic acid synthetase
MKRTRTIPDWLRIKIPGGEKYTLIKSVCERERLHTVCVEARCPNAGECFCEGQATFLIMGDVCTRHCRYCAVKHGTPQAVDPEEPARIARAVKDLSLRYVVITSVTRDDLVDGGASLFAECVRRIRADDSECGIELLIPDFMNTKDDALSVVVDSRPDCLNHNIELVEDLFSTIRPEGNYSYSIGVIERIARSGIPAKSGLMIGFGETHEQIVKTMKDLAGAGCVSMTIGQYLQSNKDAVPVTKFYSPFEFEELGETARTLGIANVMSGPLVRSSYHAERICGDIFIDIPPVWIDDCFPNGKEE